MKKTQGLTLKTVGLAMQKLSEPGNPFRRGSTARMPSAAYQPSETQERDIAIALTYANGLLQRRLSRGVPDSITDHRKEMATIRKIGRFINHILAIEEVASMR